MWKLGNKHWFINEIFYLLSHRAAGLVLDGTLRRGFHTQLDEGPETP